MQILILFDRVERNPIAVTHNGLVEFGELSNVTLAISREDYLVNGCQNFENWFSPVLEVVIRFPINFTFFSRFMWALGEAN